MLTRSWHQVSLIAFVTTKKGLEEQLLGIVTHLTLSMLICAMLTCGMASGEPVGIHDN